MVRILAISLVSFIIYLFIGGLIVIPLYDYHKPYHKHCHVRSLNECVVSEYINTCVLCNFDVDNFDVSRFCLNSIEKCRELGKFYSKNITYTTEEINTHKKIIDNLFDYYHYGLVISGIILIGIMIYTLTCNFTYDYLD